MRTKVDRSGRVVIPARIRRSLGLPDEGGEIELLDTPDGVLLRSTDAPVPRRDDRGLMVVEVGRSVSTQEVVEAVRADRERADE
jgi:AbrB family looped-hinge helix DNA binding protein